jgi:starch synthase
MPRLKILFVSPECFPFAKAGGLGDVVGALPLALAARGHDARVVLPRYRSTQRFASQPLAGALGVPFGAMTRWAGVRRADLVSARPGQPRVPLYLLEHDVLFDRSGLYGDEHGGFGDNLERYAFLSRGSIELCRYLGFEPDVIHVHDWPTSLVPLYLDTVEQGTAIARAATILTIHNMGYQGWFPLGDYPQTGMPWDRGALASLTMHGQLNLLKAGLVHATIVSTVSPRYALEIQTRHGGEGLDGILRSRGNDVIGVLNGIDDHAWDPETDAHLGAHFSAADLTGKAACKGALQREMGLPERPDVPLIGMVSRLVEQKGVDVVARALGAILDLGVQMVVLGSGEAWVEQAFQATSYASDRFRAWIGMNEALAHRIEAGADLFLMPSRYEPCGLNQMYSQRYGTLPIVRAIGGLDDTVDNGVTGFKFDELSPGALVATTTWAVDIYRHDPGRFRAMQRRAMQKTMGWSYAARQYEALYRLAMARRRA